MSGSPLRCERLEPFEKTGLSLGPDFRALPDDVKRGSGKFSTVVLVTAEDGRFGFDQIADGVQEPEEQRHDAAKSRIDGGRSPLAIAVIRATASAAFTTIDVITNARTARYHIYCLLFGRRRWKCSKGHHFRAMTGYSEAAVLEEVMPLDPVASDQGRCRFAALAPHQAER